jgi:predicted CXXCH cytochrome family protein
VIRTSLLISWTLLAACAPPDPGPAEFVGRETCVNCHSEASRDWTGSDHDLAMQTATDSTVLGDFKGATFRYAGVTTRFFRRGSRFMVRTDGETGDMKEFEVAYTFGVRPLQQYLIAFPGGRLQVLGIAWDARTIEEGGQRWFHLYADEAISAGDPLHWTGPFQNWNHMCAECHSTNLNKGYDAASRSFKTTWSEIDVSCEACHGPGSAHLSWADGESRTDDPTLGLKVSLGDPGVLAWARDPESGLPKRLSPPSTPSLTDACARCHSRRADITDTYQYGLSFLNTHLPEPVAPPLYHTDGQIRDEVYVYGSFVQSKMYQAGVTCLNCHNPHTLELRDTGNGLCLNCHGPTYQAESHSRHHEGSSGAACVNCHMPETTYMGVDARRDHSFTIPRPDLSRAAGVPNACAACHDDQTARWSEDHYRDWFGLDRTRADTAAAAFRAVESQESDAERLLLDVVSSGAAPIVRAGALRALRDYATAASIPAIDSGLGSENAMERVAAAGLLSLIPPAEAWTRGRPLLTDPVRAVRIETARVLAPAHDRIPESDRPLFESALAEYITSQTINADRPSAQVNLGLLWTALGRMTDAEAAFQEALVIAPWFVPARVNLAELLRSLGREADGEDVLRAGLTIPPPAAQLHHALGLLLVRTGRVPLAVQELAAASRLSPENIRFGYVYAVALNGQKKPDEAMRELNRLLGASPGNAELLFLGATILRDSEDPAGARSYAERMPISDPRRATLMAELD